MLLLVDCSSCRTPLQLPTGATRIRCSICHAFTLIAPEPRLPSHAPSSPLPFPSSYQVTPAPSRYIYPPQAPSPLNHAPSAPSPFSHAPSAPSPFSHVSSTPSPFNHLPPAPSPFNHAPPGPPPPVHGQKRAVIVGVSYKNTKNELKGCINDAKCMKFMLMKRFQFPESCILMLTEEEADSLRWPTKNNITMAMHWLVLGCKPGDSLVFHFSGHGNNQTDYNGDEIDGFDETLLPMDHATSGVIVDDEINATIVRPLPYGVKLHAIVDACHSGTVLDLPYLCRMDRLGNFEWEDHRPQSGTWKGTSGGEVFSFTGCDDDQTSADTPQLSGSGAWTGAMTYAFIQAIERGHGITYGSLLNAMRSTVHEIFDKNKGRELVEVDSDLLTTLLGLLILGASADPDGGEEVNQAPKKTQFVNFEVTNREAAKSIVMVPVNGSLPSTYQNPEMENVGNNQELTSETRYGLVKWLASVSNQVMNCLTLVSGERKAPRLDRSKSTAGQALKGLTFISKTDGEAGWTAVEKRFLKITANTQGLLLRSKFGECIGMNSKDFALVLFDALARRRNLTGDVIGKKELEEFWKQISDQSFDSRLMTFFDMMDRDANGRLTEDEVKEIINLSSSANHLSSIQKKSDEYAAMIMEELDPDHMGYIMVDSLKRLLLQADTQPVSTNNEERKKLSHMITENLKPTHDPNQLRRWYRQLRFFVLNNWQRIWVIVLWLTVLAILFIYKYIQYKNRAVYEVLGHCVCLAKGAAETLKLNMALILLPVCRNTITWLRNKTRLGVFVPIDDNLNFHQVIAVGIAIGVGIHSVAHLACDFPRLIAATPEDYMPLRKFFGEEQPKKYMHFVQSMEGITGLLMVLLMAFSFTLATTWFRRGKLEKKLPGPLKKLASFNAFWYTHHLFVIVYILLIIHGYYLYLSKEWHKKTTWMYLAVPVALYACERLIRAFRSSIRTVKVLKVAAYPGKVLKLEMSRPTKFKYRSGQYMFVNCPAVSPFEWHPFSITSTPQEDYLSVHIKSLGDWTEAIQGIFSEVSKPPPVGDMLHGAEIPQFPKIMIDGPYGAPAQDYKKYKVVLLIGLGIGATPMISIIKDIINNTEAKEQLNQMEKGSQQEPKGKKETFKTQRAYFYWVTKEQGTFDWFKNIMNEIAEQDKSKVIELHNHCTSVYEEGDVRSALIQMLQSLNYAKNGLDIVAGTRVMSHFARPNWAKVYKQIAMDHPGSNVGVFYCGSSILTKELRNLALEFTHKTSTRFSFHKENF